MPGTKATKAARSRAAHSPAIAAASAALLRLMTGATREDRRLAAAILLSVAYVSGWVVIRGVG